MPAACGRPAATFLERQRNFPIVRGGSPYPPRKSQSCTVVLIRRLRRGYGLPDGAAARFMRKTPLSNVESYVE